MTTPTDDAGPLADVQEAVETFKAAILKFFETNPLPDHLRQLDKDRLLTEVVTRVQQRPAAPSAPAKPHSQSQPPHAKAAKPHANHAKERAEAKAKHPDLEGLAEFWDKKFPEDKTSVADLDPSFGPNAAKFIKAMKAAGLSVTVAGAKRSPERAYLMRCAFLIYEGKYSVVVSELSQKPSKVDINWEEIKKTAGDEEGFKDFAVLLAAKLGIGLDFSAAPSLTSNHIHGKAVDLVIDGWNGTNVEVTDAHGKKTPIKTFEDLKEVGDTYGVHHFPKPGEPNHWSLDSH